MSSARLAYRARQFFLALQARPPSDLQTAQTLLSPALLELFRGLQSDEQSHSLSVLRRLREQGENDPDLLVAALLHDVGKARFPLRLWERVWIVLVKSLLPGYAARWGAGAPRGIHRSLVIAARHPAWGAEMAQQAGASPRVVELIRRHQEMLPPAANSPTECLLRKLQAADEES